MLQYLMYLSSILSLLLITGAINGRPWPITAVLVNRMVAIICEVLREGRE